MHGMGAGAGGGNLSKISSINLNGKANIPTDFLRTFVTIYELGSFTKAARIFGLTQPAVSAQIRKLELMIGGDLLERKSPGVALTNRGSEILKFARRMLSINDQILAFSGSRATAAVVRVGVSNMFAIDILQKLTSNQGLRVGNWSLQISCDSSKSLVDRIRGGYLDIACIVGDEPELDDAEISWSEEFVWVRGSGILLDGSLLIPLIGSPNHGLSDRLAVEALVRANRKYEILFSAHDRITRHAAAAAGLGYIALPRRAVPATLTIEPDGALPALRSVATGIIGRDGLDATELVPLTRALESVLRHSAGAV